MRGLFLSSLAGLALFFVHTFATPVPSPMFNSLKFKLGKSKIVKNGGGVVWTGGEKELYGVELPFRGVGKKTEDVEAPLSSEWGYPDGVLPAPPKSAVRSGNRERMSVRFADAGQPVVKSEGGTSKTLDKLHKSKRLPRSSSHLSDWENHHSSSQPEIDIEPLLHSVRSPDSYSNAYLKQHSW